MEVIYILLPISLVFVAVAVVVFARAVRSGQFDDLETPPWRVIADDDGDAKRGRKEKGDRPAAVPDREQK